MEWLSDLVTLLLESIAGLDVSSKLGGSLHFFIYDVIKIFILLTVLIFFISYVQSYFPPERTRMLLGGREGLLANTMAALLGTLTPFCSCSSIPIFIGFTSAGLPLAVTFSFLISSPLVDLASIILLASIFNWPVALSYVAIGLVLAVLGGTLIGRLHLEDQVEDFVFRNPIGEQQSDVVLTVYDRLFYARGQVLDIVQRVWLYVLIGVGIGAVIHNWIPEDIVTDYLGQDAWWSVPIAVLSGIPMYADIFGSLPIAEALVTKGAGLGTALAFMMSVTALSLPAVILLKRVVKLPLIAIFLGVTAFGIVLIGYLFNNFAYLLINGG